MEICIIEGRFTLPSRLGSSPLQPSLEKDTARALEKTASGLFSIAK